VENALRQSTLDLDRDTDNESLSPAQFQVQEAINANKSLIASNTNLINNNAHLSESLKTANKQIQDLIRSNRDLKEQLQSRSSLFWSQTNWKAEYNTAKKELEKANEEEEKHLNWIAQLKDQLMAARQKVDFYQDASQRDQEQSFKRMSDARWTPVDDATIRNDFIELQRSIRDWAKEYSTTPLRWDVLHPDTRQEFLQYLSRVVQLTSKGTLPHEFISSTSNMTEKWPHMLLSAELAYEIQTQFFHRPFFCLNKETKTDSVDPLSSVYSVYNQLLEGAYLSRTVRLERSMLIVYVANLHEGHSWRAQMLRILNPPQGATSTQKEKDTSRETFLRVRSLCDNLAKQFRESPARLLLQMLQTPEDRANRQRELREIFMKAAELATSLWTQKSYLRCEGLRELKDRTFRNGSPIMEAHRLHKLDDEDPRLDGRPISIVIQPTVLAIGNHEGEFMDPARPRVLAKAVVWVDK
jgi:myosin heavy subunit